MTRIAIVTGSTRNGRVNPQVAQYIQSIASQRDDVDYEILDIADYNLPLYSESVPTIANGGNYETPEAYAWASAVDGFDGFVFIVAEYNRGVTAALKSAIDYVYSEWNDKAAAIVSYGSSGGQIAASSLREVLSTLQIAVVSQQPSFNLFTDFENMAVFTPQLVHESSISGMLNQVEKWATALAGARVTA